MLAAWRERLPKPYRPMVPMIVAVAFLFAASAGVHYLALVLAQARLAETEAAGADARHLLIRHSEAKQAQQDYAKVMNRLPLSRDFSTLPLLITDMAKQDRVLLPSMSYTLEKSRDNLPAKAVLQGAAIGAYDDLRRFIHRLESSGNALVFIEDLSVSQSTAGQGEHADRKITVAFRFATYIREEPRHGTGLKASAR